MNKKNVILSEAAVRSLFHHKLVKWIQSSGLAALAVLACSASPVAAETFQVWADTYSVNGMITKTAGSAPSLLVGPNHTAYIKFCVTNACFTADQVTAARLVLYFPSVPAAGTLELYANTSDFSEVPSSPEKAPAQNATNLGTLEVNSSYKQNFAVMDVTTQVQAWMGPGTMPDYGFAIKSTQGATVTIGAKEGSATGYPAVLEVDVTPSYSAMVSATNGTFSDTVTATNMMAASVCATNLAAGTLVARNAAFTNLSAFNAAITNLTAGTVTADTLNGNLTAGTVTATSFSGNGVGLTNVDLTTVNQQDAITFPPVYGNQFTLATRLQLAGAPSCVTAVPNAASGFFDLIWVSTDGMLTVLSNNGFGGFRVSATIFLGSNSVPRCVTAADVNSDGLADLITANSDNSTLTVLTNNGNGGFVLSQVLPLQPPSTPVSVAGSYQNSAVGGFGAFQHYSDLCCANSGTWTVSIFRNNQNGRFVEASTFPPLGVPAFGAPPVSVTAADVNSDGNPDFICASGNQLMVFLFDPVSSGYDMQAPISLSDPMTQISAVTAADLAGTGIMDLITANSNANTLTVLMGDGAGNFPTPYNLSVGAAPVAVIAADLAGSGWPDLICATASNTLVVFTNNGTDVVPQPTTYNTGSGPVSLMAADLNGAMNVNQNYLMDLISVNAGDSTLTVLTNTPTFPTANFNGEFYGDSHGTNYGTFSGDAFGNFNGNFSGDASGNFSGTFSGNASGNFSGNFPSSWVGIGTTSPGAPLDVESTYATSINAAPYFNPNSGSSLQRWPSGNLIGLSILTPGWVEAAGFVAESDRRIKDVVGQSDQRKDLETIERLKVTDYRLKDRVAEGDRLHKGFIAQEVQAVIPEAVSKGRNFIPDIYAVAEKLTFDKGAQTLRVRLAKAHDLKEGDLVRLITDDGRVERKVAAVPDEKTFVVSSITREPRRLFVYGRQVDDFLAVDYDRIFSTGISAIQELAARTEKLEARESHLAVLEQKAAEVSTLEQEVAGLKKMVEQLAQSNKGVNLVAQPAVWVRPTPIALQPLTPVTPEH